MAFVGSMPPVGPIALLLLERGLSGREGEGRRIGLGAALAETFYCALAMAGVSALMIRYAVVDTIARAAGALLLLGLGAYLVRFVIATAPLGDGGPRPSPPRRRAFVLGFAISIANPTLILTWCGSIGMLLSFSGLHLDKLERGAFVVGVFLGMLGWFQVFLWMLRRYRGRVTLRAAQRTIRFAGVFMVVLGLYGLRRLVVIAPPGGAGLALRIVDL
jgi:threonine/homoserine/homoserine lactone efflux protein